VPTGVIDRDQKLRNGGKSFTLFLPGRAAPRTGDGGAGPEFFAVFQENSRKLKYTLNNFKWKLK
jgi:hypothetical protein